MTVVKIGKMQLNADVLNWSKEQVIEQYSAKYPKGHKLEGKPMHNAENIWKAIQDHKKTEAAKAKKKK